MNKKKNEFEVGEGGEAKTSKHDIHVVDYSPSFKQRLLNYPIGQELKKSKRSKKELIVNYGLDVVSFWQAPMIIYLNNLVSISPKVSNSQF